MLEKHTKKPAPECQLAVYSTVWFVATSKSEIFLGVEIPKPSSDPRSEPQKKLRSADLNPKKNSDPTKILTLKIADLKMGTTLVRPGGSKICFRIHLSCFRSASSKQLYIRNPGNRNMPLSQPRALQPDRYKKAEVQSSLVWHKTAAEIFCVCISLP